MNIARCGAIHTLLCAVQDFSNQNCNGSVLVSTDYKSTQILIDTCTFHHVLKTSFIYSSISMSQCHLQMYVATLLLQWMCDWNLHCATQKRETSTMHHQHDLIILCGSSSPPTITSEIFTAINFFNPASRGNRKMH